MKIINKVLFVLVLLVYFTSCKEEPNILEFKEGAIVHFTTSSGMLSAENNEDVYEIEIGTTSANSATVNLEIDPSSTAVEGVDFSISSKSITIESGKFLGNTTITPMVDNLEIGVPVTVVVNIMSETEGFSQTFTLTILRICIPAPGDYTIMMHDSYGDGWQTTDGDSGDGIQVTLDDGTVIEVGMCSYWAASGFDCVTGDYSNAEATVTIPDTALSADWYFPGDYFGEISFEVYSPTDELLFESGDPGALGAGAFTIINCR